MRVAGSESGAWLRGKQIYRKTLPPKIMCGYNKFGDVVRRLPDVRQSVKMTLSEVRRIISSRRVCVGFNRLGFAGDVAAWICGVSRD